MRRMLLSAGAGLVVAAGFVPILLWAQDPEAPEMAVADPVCSFFGPQRDRYVEALRNRHAASELTEAVAAKLPDLRGAGASPEASFIDRRRTEPNNLVDRHIFEKLAAEGVAPAPPTNDFEFIRRVTLDLTGRVPTMEQTASFAANGDPEKRAKWIEGLLGSPQWVDKWTVWFGDLYENNSNNDLAARRFIQGVVAFNQFIRTSLQTNKPYDRMVREMIAATGNNSYQQGELNFHIGGVMGGGPIQDVFDKQIAVVVDKFLGISHLDCLLCHDGRRHLDSLSLWGYYASRQDAYAMASFMSHTATVRVPVNDGQGNPYYWALIDEMPPLRPRGPDYRIDYQLNTTTGNRPARTPIAGKTTVAPAYMFTGETAPPGEPYRVALGRMLTADFQFARATVNYLWEYFFGIGLVSPSNQFDPMRLDPDHPPTDCPLEVSPCTLQASHPRLLNELAQYFIDSGYDLKSVMRLIVNSRAYQLSSRYEGEWNPNWERLFARKLVRRLWPEELADAIVQTSGIAMTYNNNVWGPVNWAMQLPEPLNTGNSAANFLNAFLRGNRDDQKRSGDGSISQALAMMNDPFVVSRAVTNNPNGLVTRNLSKSNTELVTTLYFTVLSRYPTDAELNAAVTRLASGDRRQEAQNLLWSLYNKVDFIYNY